MGTNLTATLLVDDKIISSQLIPEHGLSWLLNFGTNQYLFDTGQGAALSMNAAALNVLLAEVNAVILSHGHYDHSGGLRCVIDVNQSVRVYSHPKVAIPRFSLREDGRKHQIGMPFGIQSCLSDMRQRWIRTSDPTVIDDMLWMTGSIRRNCAFEMPDVSLFTDEIGSNVDAFEDDQAVFVETSRGSIVFLGCCHAGVCNTLTAARNLTRDKPIFAVLGGFPLSRAESSRIEQTIKAMRSLGVQNVAPRHCTGDTAKDSMRQAFGSGFRHCAAGEIFIFDLD